MRVLFFVLATRQVHVRGRRNAARPLPQVSEFDQLGGAKLVSFVDRTRVESALTLAFLISLAWVCALAMLLRTTPTHSVDAGSKPSLQRMGVNTGF
jgi:hypothetical protein